MCPGGTEALQTAAKDCTPCRPGNSHHANLKLQGPKKSCLRVLLLIIEKKGKHEFPSRWYLVFEQACTSPPIRPCVKSAAVAPSRSAGARKAAMYAQRITTALWVLHLPLEEMNLCLLEGVLGKFGDRACCFLRVQTWTPFSVPAMHFVRRAAWLQATAWRLSSAKQGTRVNWLQSLLLF